VDRSIRLEAVRDEEPVHVAEERPIEADRADSFEAFATDNYQRLFAALCLVTGDRFDAEEIAQEALVRVLERWDMVSGLENPQGYLFRVAFNVFRSRLRRAKTALLKAVAPRSMPDAFEAVEDREIVVSGLRDVTPDQRAALVATALLGYSSEEAARLLGTTASNVRARATRARAAMRGAIGDER
jgi:RNA polymerase sigma factor (sigma-70 family)